MIDVTIMRAVYHCAGSCTAYTVDSSGDKEEPPDPDDAGSPVTTFLGFHWEVYNASGVKLGSALAMPPSSPEYPWTWTDGPEVFPVKESSVKTEYYKQTDWQTKCTKSCGSNEVCQAGTCKATCIETGAACRYGGGLPCCNNGECSTSSLAGSNCRTCSASQFVFAFELRFPSSYLTDVRTAYEFGTAFEIDSGAVMQGVYIQGAPVTPDTVTINIYSFDASLMQSRSLAVGDLVPLKSFTTQRSGASQWVEGRGFSTGPIFVEPGQAGKIKCKQTSNPTFDVPV